VDLDAVPLTAVAVVARGHIVAVGPSDTPTPAAAERIDATGKVIMPGLVDTHGHVVCPIATWQWTSASSALRDAHRQTADATASDSFGRPPDRLSSRRVFFAG
jgi:imidazolonepropionase-like amidohydrolase